MSEKFYVKFALEGRFTAEVTAKTIKEALENAHGKYVDAYFGEAEEPDEEVIDIEDEHGKVVYERETQKGKDLEFDSPQKLFVRYRVQARYVASPFAEDADDAIEQGEYELAETSFGELEIEDSEAIYVENSDGDFVWEAD